MTMIRNLALPSLVAIAMLVATPYAQGATMHDVAGWVVHNGASAIAGAGTNSPSFTPADDNMTAMGTFTPVHLANDGDFVTLTTTLDLGTRTGAGGTNALNTQLRIGLFDGADPIVAADTNTSGFWMEYSNAGGLVRESNPAQTDPMINPLADIGSLDPDAGGNSIQGLTPGPISFELTMTRNGGMLEITGQISGTDSVSGNPFLSVISPALSYAPQAAGFDFNFNRVAIGFRNNVNSPTGILSDTQITTNVPEPGTGVLAAILALGGLLSGRKRV